jgi:hypothetical protein
MLRRRLGAAADLGYAIRASRMGENSGSLIQLFAAYVGCINPIDRCADNTASTIKFGEER